MTLTIALASYLDGHGALFPDAAQAWTEQIRSSEATADAVVRLVELDGLPAAAAGDSEAMPRRTTEFVADLVEPAKSDALEKLGEGRQALDIATGWVRAKLTPKAADNHWMVTARTGTGAPTQPLDRPASNSRSNFRRERP